jgi:hypothetical protein
MLVGHILYAITLIAGNKYTVVEGLYMGLLNHLHKPPKYVDKNPKRGIP